MKTIQTKIQNWTFTFRNRAKGKLCFSEREKNGVVLGIRTTRKPDDCIGWSCNDMSVRSLTGTLSLKTGAVTVEEGFCRWEGLDITAELKSSVVDKVYDAFLALKHDDKRILDFTYFMAGRKHPIIKRTMYNE